MPIILSTHKYTFEKTGFYRRTGIRIGKITGFLDFGRLVLLYVHHGDAVKALRDHGDAVKALQDHGDAVKRFTGPW